MESLLAPLTGFKDQFNFEPVVSNSRETHNYNQIVICGMGGSAICVSLLKLLFPELPITLHNSYGLPATYIKETTLFILNSYSGNTEEILESFDRAKKDGAHIAILSRGGELIMRAKATSDTYIELPDSHLEPRFSIGHQLISLLVLLGEKEKIKLLRERITLLDMQKIEAQGKALAKQFEHKYPILYASSNLYPVAYLIKAAINEGAKTPSFVNLIPEANHNELQSFVTSKKSTEHEHFGFLFVTSTYDHTRILKRCNVMEELYKEHNFTTRIIESDHTSILSIFELIVGGYYMATYMAIAKGVDPYTTPLIAEFKKRMAQ